LTKLPFGLGIGESIAALIAIVLIVFVIAYYFSSLGPEQDNLRRLEAELAAQQRSIIASAQPTSETAHSAADMAKDALESLEDFKGSHLKPFSSGRIALINEINALAKKNNVTLTSGIDMGANAGEQNGESDEAGEKKSDSRRKKIDEMLNAFPSVSFRFTAFGQYPSLRTFINQLEHEKQFVVISSINLSNQEAKTPGRRSRAEGVSGVMVTIEMFAYFRPA
jgi:hypothetical protein